MTGKYREKLLERRLKIKALDSLIILQKKSEKKVMNF